MSWTYDYEAQSTDLLDYCEGIAVVDESGGGKSGADSDVGWVDGQRREPKVYAPMTIPLKTVLRYTNASGAVTHPNGQAGHIYENLHALKRLFEAPGLKILTRDDPDAGAVRAEFELIGEPQLGEMRHIFYWPLRIPSGSWQDESQSSQSGNPPSVTTGGTRRIHDPEIEFSAAGTFTYTDSDGTEHEIVAASGPTYPVTVSFDNGEWTATDDASADAGPFITPSQPWVMRFEPDSALSLSTTVACTVRWRNRWA